MLTKNIIFDILSFACMVFLTVVQRALTVSTVSQTVETDSTQTSDDCCSPSVLSG